MHQGSIIFLLLTSANAVKVKDVLQEILFGDMYDNYNYPAGADTSDAPWNQSDVPEKEFDVTCSQSLSKTVIVITDDYVPGAEGVDYESDDEGGCHAFSWQDPDDTSDTNWAKEYSGNNHLTPLQLIETFKEFLEKQLNETNYATPEGKKECNKLQHLIEECTGWIEDDYEFVNENS